MSIIKKAQLLNIIFCIVIVACSVFASGHGWQYYLKKGEVQYRAEMFDYAIFNLQKSLDMNYNNYRAANLLAEIFVAKDKKLRAINYYQISLKRNNDQADVHARLAELLEFFNEKKQAFYHFQEAVKSNPNHLKANLALVRFFLDKNNTASAQKCFKISYNQGMKIFGDLLRKAKNALLDEDDSRAMHLYQKIIRNSPSIIEAYFTLCALYRKRDESLKAAQIIEKLKFIRPDLEKAYIILGEIYFTKKLPGKKIIYLNKAIKNLKEAIRINPENYNTYYSLSTIYRVIGKSLKAEAMENKAIKIESRSDKQK